MDLGPHPSARPRAGGTGGFCPRRRCGVYHWAGAKSDALAYVSMQQLNGMKNGNARIYARADSLSRMLSGCLLTLAG